MYTAKTERLLYPGRIISVSASLPNNVDTSRSITFHYNYVSFAVSDMQMGKQLSQVT